VTDLSIRQDVETEAAVIGSLLVAEPAAVAVIEEVGLRAREFGFDRNAIVFTAICDLHAQGKPHDELSVVAELEARDLLSNVGGRHAISEFAAKVPAAGNARHYAEVVRACAIDREKAKIGLELTNGLSPVEAIQRLEGLSGALRTGPNSWAPEDLTSALDGVTEPAPTVLSRSDGAALLYDGRLHQLSAEPEAGKGWFACRASADLIRAGCSVAYFDFEATAAEIVGRLQSLGVSREHIQERLIYVRPHEPLTSCPGALEAILAHSPALVVFDGVTEALTIHGLSLEDNADVAKWLELAPRPAARSGAATLLIDHEVKNKDNRGRYAIGAQHKLAGIDVAFKLKEGLCRVKLTKDRPGHLGVHAAGETREVAQMRLRSGSDESVTVELEPPDPEANEEFKPTILMTRISEALEATPGMTTREIRGLGGKSQLVDSAVHHLIAGGFVRKAQEGSAHRHYLLKPYVDEEEEA
jgi:DnaB-like helicase N terminal domain/AAA domain